MILNHLINLYTRSLFHFLISNLNISVISIYSIYEYYKCFLIITLFLSINRQISLYIRGYLC